MLKRTEEYMKQNGMVQKQETVVLGLSGGQDSVCLFHVLRNLGVSMVAVHVNHGIRGEEANRDEKFVETLCSQYQIPLYTYRFDVPRISKEQHRSEEETGRMLRRQAFEEVKECCGAAAVALAHHEKDRAETFLFHLIRGAGIRGLSSMKPVDGIWIRPLLWAAQSEISEFMRTQRYAFVEDSTNAEECYTRNKMRHKVLPELEALNPAAVRHICGAADKLEKAVVYIEREARALFERAVEMKEQEVFIEKEAFYSGDEVLWVPVLQMCVEALYGSLKNMTEEHYKKIRLLFEMQTGRQVVLPSGLLATRTYEGIKLGYPAEKEALVPVEISGPGTYWIAGKKITVKVEDWIQGENFPINHYTKCFDYDKIQGNVFLRGRQPGDYLEINKDHGRKNLQDYFVNEKVPKEQRDGVILLAEDSHILWVVGKRISEYYKVSQNTKRILKVQMDGEGHEEV